MRIGLFFRPVPSTSIGTETGAHQIPVLVAGEVGWGSMVGLFLERAEWCVGGGREKRRRRVQVLRRKTFTGLTGRIGIAVGRAVAAISPKQGLFLCMHACTRNEQRVPEVGHREGAIIGMGIGWDGYVFSTECLLEQQEMNAAELAELQDSSGVAQKQDSGKGEKQMGPW